MIENYQIRSHPPEGTTGHHQVNEKNCSIFAVSCVCLDANVHSYVSGYLNGTRTLLSLIQRTGIKTP